MGSNSTGRGEPLPVTVLPLPLTGIPVAAFLALGLAACAGAAIPPAAGTPLDGAWSLVYTCDDNHRFSTRSAGERIFLVHQGRSHELTRDPDEPARYAGDELLFSGQTEDATLIGPTFRYTDCDAQPAASPWEDAAIRDVAYRAIGQEPGWYVEWVPGETLLYVGDYGETVTQAGAPVDEVDSAHRRTEVSATGADGPLLLRIQETSCIDVMSGEGYPTRASITVGGRTLQGCGRWLR